MTEPKQPTEEEKKEKKESGISGILSSATIAISIFAFVLAAVAYSHSRGLEKRLAKVEIKLADARAVIGLDKDDNWLRDKKSGKPTFTLKELSHLQDFDPEQFERDLGEKATVGWAQGANDRLDALEGKPEDDSLTSEIDLGKLKEDADKATEAAAKADAKKADEVFEINCAELISCEGSAACIKKKKEKYGCTEN